MKNSFGTNISLTLFGESHGEKIGIVLDGLPAGFEISMERLEADMDKRKAKGKLSTQRHEGDEVHIVSGFFNGKTTGTALTIFIDNTNTRSKDYASIQYRLRPGHADYTAFEKYSGYQDYRGGGHFSGRLTAAICAAGSICRQILESKGVQICSHIQNLHGIEDDFFDQDPQVFIKQKEQIEASSFPVLNEEVSVQMQEFVAKCASELDSCGAVLETLVTGLPAGLGEPFFDSVESILSHLIFSIPAVKGVSFGSGFGFGQMKGSQANDAFVWNPDEKKIMTKTNHNAGINGGITNGMPIQIHTVIKPTPSIFQKQESVDYQTKEAVVLEIKGRHDPFIAHRARIVLDGMVAFGLLDLWMSHAATTAFEKESSV
jgi:chorismate synthase